MKKRVSSIDLVYSLAKQAREHKTSWAAGFSIDKSILGFAQKKGIISYRYARALNSNRAQIEKLQSEFIVSVEEIFKPDTSYTWELFLVSRDSDEPCLFPRSLGEDRKPIHRKDRIKQLLQENEELSAKHNSFKSALQKFSVLTKPIYDWIDKLFVSGTLESEIEEHKKQKEGKRGKTRISRALISNLIDPKVAEEVRKDGELPFLTKSERQTIQFLLWKSENMTDRERHLKDLLLDGKNENPKENGLLIVFELQEAVQTNYDATQRAGYYYAEIRNSLKILCQKHRKLLLRGKNEELKISIPLIKREDIEHRYIEDPEFRKYAVVYIDHRIADLREQYTPFPHNHFALLRKTPPKTRLNESEITFFDFLFSEVSYDPQKTNTVKRKKLEFLKILDVDGSFAEACHLSRLAERIESIFVAKATNLKLLKAFSIDVNREGEEVYIFTIAPRQEISCLA